MKSMKSILKTQRNAPTTTVQELPLGNLLSDTRHGNVATFRMAGHIGRQLAELIFSGPGRPLAFAAGPARRLRPAARNPMPYLTRHCASPRSSPGRSAPKEIRRTSRYWMPASPSPRPRSGQPSPHRRAMRRAGADRPARARAGGSARRQRRLVPACHGRGLAPGTERPRRPALPVRHRRIRPSRREPQWGRAVQSGSARHLRAGPFGAALPPRRLPEITAPRPSASITITRSERTLPTP